MAERLSEGRNLDFWKEVSQLENTRATVASAVDGVNSPKKLLSCSLINLKYCTRVYHMTVWIWKISSMMMQKELPLTLTVYIKVTPLWLAAKAFVILLLS